MIAVNTPEAAETIPIFKPRISGQPDQIKGLGPIVVGDYTRDREIEGYPNTLPLNRPQIGICTVAASAIIFTLLLFVCLFVCLFDKRPSFRLSLVFLFLPFLLYV